MIFEPAVVNASEMFQILKEKPDIHESDNRDVVKYLRAVKQGKFNDSFTVIKIKTNYFTELGLKERDTGVS